jgi:lipid-A-disaccharide synthase
MKVMVSAGEVSGDLHGAFLVRELKKTSPDIKFFGLGSDRLKSEGVDIRFDISRRSTIGIFEALPNLIPIYLVYLRTIHLMKKEKPDLLLLIDSQGFNIPLARAAKKLGIKTVYYIAPQEWLWGTPAGVKKIAETIDLIVAIFEKEYNSYKNAGGNVVYFGHPLIDIITPSLSRNAARKKYLGAEDKKLLISLCPGSRTQEIKNLLPLLVKSALLIGKEFPAAVFFIPAASDYISNIIPHYMESLEARIIVGQTHDILFASDLALCASGTINLESSVLGVPNIMVYKLSPLTYFIGKNILKIDKKLPYFSMPNFILNEKVVPELVMGMANPVLIAAEAVSILKDPSRADYMKNSFSRLKTLLGQPGVLPKISQAIIDFLSL